MDEQISKCYVLTKRLDAMLKQWAAQDDRSASAQLRHILDWYAEHRKRLEIQSVATK